MHADGSPVSVVAGRVATLSLADDTNVASVKVLNDPQHGNVTVNPDNTLAVVLSDTGFTGQLSFDYELTYNDGTTSSFSSGLNVTQAPKPRAGAWVSTMVCKRTQAIILLSNMATITGKFIFPAAQTPCPCLTLPPWKGCRSAPSMRPG